MARLFLDADPSPPPYLTPLVAASCRGRLDLISFSSSSCGVKPGPLGFCHLATLLPFHRPVQVRKTVASCPEPPFVAVDLHSVRPISFTFSPPPVSAVLFFFGSESAVPPVGSAAVRRIRQTPLFPDPVRVPRDHPLQFVHSPFWLAPVFLPLLLFPTWLSTLHARW